CLVVAERVAALVVGEGATVGVDVAGLVVKRDVQEVGAAVDADVVDGRGGTRILGLRAAGFRQVGAVVKTGFVGGCAGNGGIGLGHQGAPARGADSVARAGVKAAATARDR